jgi:hypothetical protein
VKFEKRSALNNTIALIENSRFGSLPSAPQIEDLNPTEKRRINEWHEKNKD